jgi:hypothetical protein
MFSEEMEAASPPCGSHLHGAKGLWALGGLTACTVVGHRTDHKPYVRGGSRLWTNQGKMGCMCTST